MTVVEAECDAPIPGHRYSRKASEVSLERMWPEARNVHIIRLTFTVQYRKNVAMFFNMRGNCASCRSSIIKGFEPAMFKRLNHFKVLYPSRVACRLSIDKRQPLALGRDLACDIEIVTRGGQYRRLCQFNRGDIKYRQRRHGDPSDGRDQRYVIGFHSPSLKRAEMAAFILSTQ